MIRSSRCAALAVAVVPLLASACVDTFDGADVQMDLSPAFPVQASLAETTPGTGEIPAQSHFSLYAVKTDYTGTDSLFFIQSFEVHHIVDLGSPCYIDDAQDSPHPGLHVSQYAKVIGIDTGISDVSNPPPGATMEQEVEAATADQREQDVELLAGPAGLHAVTSVSTVVYPAVAPTCAAAASDPTMIPPPTCIDNASNAQRLAVCKQTWASDPNFWEGTDLILTSPLAGTTDGFVDGENPINQQPVGGTDFYVGSVLVDVDAYAIYQEADGSDGTGELLLYGTPEMLTRGVEHVHMTSPISSELTADLAVFPDLDDDKTQF